MPRSERARWSSSLNRSCQLWSDQSSSNSSVSFSHPIMSELRCRRCYVVPAIVPACEAESTENQTHFDPRRRSLRQAAYPQLPGKQELLHHARGHDPPYRGLPPNRFRQTARPRRSGASCVRISDLYTSGGPVRPEPALEMPVASIADFERVPRAVEHRYPLPPRSSCRFG